MGKYALALPGAALLLCLSASLFAQTASPSASPSIAPPVSAAETREATNLVVAYTAWDDDFFYVAVQVNKPTSRGKNAKAFSNPREDDAVFLSFQIDDDRTALQPTAKTRTVAVSAAGGTQVYLGPQSTPLYDGLGDFQARLTEILKNEKDEAVKQTKSSALLASLLKCVVAQHGAMRPIGTLAAGYSFELAVPWSDLGGRPAAGARMGFNIVAQSAGVRISAVSTDSTMAATMVSENCR